METILSSEFSLTFLTFRPGALRPAGL